MITVGYIRCDLDRSQAALLQPPAGAPVFYANAIDQSGPSRQAYRTMFGRARWRQE